jgi:hypothetical protein
MGFDGEIAVKTLPGPGNTVAEIVKFTAEPGPCMHAAGLL